MNLPELPPLRDLAYSCHVLLSTSSRPEAAPRILSPVSRFLIPVSRSFMTSRARDWFDVHEPDELLLVDDLLSATSGSRVPDDDVLYALAAMSSGAPADAAQLLETLVSAPERRPLPFMTEHMAVYFEGSPYGTSAFLAFSPNRLAVIVLLVCAYAGAGKFDYAAALAHRAFEDIQTGTFLVLELQMQLAAGRFDEVIRCARQFCPPYASDRPLPPMTPENAQAPAMYEIGMLCGEACEASGRIEDALSYYSRIAAGQPDLLWGKGGRTTARSPLGRDPTALSLAG